MFHHDVPRLVPHNSRPYPCVYCAAVTQPAHLWRWVLVTALSPAQPVSTYRGEHWGAPHSAPSGHPDTTPCQRRSRPSTDMKVSNKISQTYFSVHPRCFVKFSILTFNSSFMKRVSISIYLIILKRQDLPSCVTRVTSSDQIVNDEIFLPSDSVMVCDDRQWRAVTW